MSKTRLKRRKCCHVCADSGLKRRCLRRRHNGQNLPSSVVHTDWRLSECRLTKRGEKPAHSRPTAGHPQTRDSKTCTAVTLELHLTFRDTFGGRLGQILCQDTADTFRQTAELWGCLDNAGKYQDVGPGCSLRARARACGRACAVPFL